MIRKFRASPICRVARRRDELKEETGTYRDFFVLVSQVMVVPWIRHGWWRSCCCCCWEGAGRFAVTSMARGAYAAQLPSRLACRRTSPHIFSPNAEGSFGSFLTTNPISTGAVRKRQFFFFFFQPGPVSLHTLCRRRRPLVISLRKKNNKKKNTVEITLALFKFPAKQPFRMAKCGRVVCVCCCCRGAHAAAEAPRTLACLAPCH